MDGTENCILESRCVLHETAQVLLWANGRVCLFGVVARTSVYRPDKYHHDGNDCISYRCNNALDSTPAFHSQQNDHSLDTALY